MATTNGSTAIRDKILASLARYRALRIGKFPCAFWRLSARPGLTADESDEDGLGYVSLIFSECNSCSSRVLLAHVESANCPVDYQGLKITTSLSSVSMIFSDRIRVQRAQARHRESEKSVSKCAGSDQPFELLYDGNNADVDLRGSFKNRSGTSAQSGGESLFLRKLVLGIPAQASGKNLTRPLMPPAAPIRPRHLVPTQQGVGT
ncbi:hypothetical protein BJAS_P3146 [Bathymodiolus japonicus methanotrophic gill symbiont]|nr:hypothetical protein BJAS_P3146 [Bathymodiolus japonicus methanotrophic gill symbiont]